MIVTSLPALLVTYSFCREFAAVSAAEGLGKAATRTSSAVKRRYTVAAPVIGDCSGRWDDEEVSPFRISLTTCGGIASKKAARTWSGPIYCLAGCQLAGPPTDCISDRAFHIT